MGSLLKMLTLEEYLLIATKLIKAYRKRNGHLVESDELIGTVVRYLATADHKYQEGKSSLTREKYRRMFGIYGIRIYEKYRRRLYSINENVNYDKPTSKVDLSAKLKFAIDNAELTPRHKELIRLYVEGYKPKVIASMTGINVFAVYKGIENAIKLMKRVVK